MCLWVVSGCWRKGEGKQNSLREGSWQGEGGGGGRRGGGGGGGGRIDKG